MLKIFLSKFHVKFDKILKKSLDAKWPVVGRVGENAVEKYGLKYG